MRKLTELERAIRAVDSQMGLLAGPGSEMEKQWHMVKLAAQKITEPQPASTNISRDAIASCKCGAPRERR